MVGPAAPEAGAPFQLTPQARLGLTVATTLYPACLSLRSLRRGNRRGQAGWLWYWVLAGGAMGLDALVSQLGGWEAVWRVMLRVGALRAWLGLEGRQGGSALRQRGGQPQREKMEGNTVGRERVKEKSEKKNSEAKSSVGVRGEARERRRMEGEDVAKRALREEQDEGSELKSVQQMAREIEDAEGKREMVAVVEKSNPKEEMHTGSEQSDDKQEQKREPTDACIHHVSAKLSGKEDGECHGASSKGGEDVDVRALGSNPELGNHGADLPSKKEVAGKPFNGVEKTPGDKCIAPNKEAWEAPKLTPVEAVPHQEAGEVSATFLKDAADSSVRERAEALTHHVETQPKFRPLKERPEDDVEALVVNTDFQYAPERKVNKPVESAITPTANKVSANFISSETTSVKDKTLALQNYIDEQPKFRPAQVPR